MIHVDEVAEPPGFPEFKRKGNEWLADHPNARSTDFPDYWSRFRDHLAAGFKDLCGYSAMRTSKPTVDHFIPKSSPEGRSLTYEWSNYRFADQELNTAKSTLVSGVLDPFTVGNDWFEVLLPNLEMIMTERVPDGYLGDARAMLRDHHMGLGDSDAILKIRRSFYEPFLEGDVTLAHVARGAPLIARAVEKRLSEITPAVVDDARRWFEGLLDGVYNLKAVRQDAPRLAEQIDSLLARPDPRYRRRS